ncbi:ADP-ribose glycohydrolase MACROD2 isoform X2 [Esox lucius]|uniref:ADP-ribose glycohydrolase MACROD2 isoform X2 n=1 Tax=Esox lucius TaxID=8010 RepID=UPI0010BD8D43|nr:ADP-ribose glycohydrolase MACROD2 isoform X2 [Esox lucius]
MSKKKKDWKTEKERLMRMSLEDRRAEYRRSEYVPLDKIASRRPSQSTGEDEEEKEKKDLLSDKIILYKGDITMLEVDAIVNAANSSLLGGGGVDGCIHKAAGSCLYDECYTLNGCETGNAKITGGYDLPSRYVIHTVGPVARGHVGETETEDLTACYQNSLKLVKDYNLRSVAFPCISTGIYGFPNEPAAAIALKTVKSWVKENRDKIDHIIFCVFLENDYKIYKEKIPQVFQEETCEQNSNDSQTSMEQDNKTVNKDLPKGEEKQKDEEEELEEKVESDCAKGDNKPEETSEVKEEIIEEEPEEMAESAAKTLMKNPQGGPTGAVTTVEDQNDTSNNEIQSGQGQDSDAESNAQGEGFDGSQLPQTGSTQSKDSSIQKE